MNAPASAKRRGVALVIVISLIALLTVVTVALLLIVGQSTQRTANEVAAHQSEALAQTAFEVLLADLSDEMASGSNPVVLPEPKRADGTTYRVYDLTNKREGMRVTSSVITGAPGGNVLAKQSQPEKPFHTWPLVPGKVPLVRASTVTTDSGNTPFAPALWEMPKYLAPADLFSSSTAPRWIYLARNGSNPTTYSDTLRREKVSGGEPNPEFVLGRYAYNLYNTSGLLDINVAGHPRASDPNGVPSEQRVGDKGSQAFADISVLPGMSTEAMDLVARWRHQWQADTALNEKYLQRSEGAGWRSMFANDNVFLNRQDLLAFWQSQSLPLEALASLTHFSRDLNAPSYRPDPARPRLSVAANQGGNDAVGFDDVINPDPMVYDAGRKGEMIQRRFPLDRLVHVATPKGGALDADTIAKAEKYFGLRWESAEGVWSYVHARPNGSISTLVNVPLDREPNFFELLKASIITGSLGKQCSSHHFEGYRTATTSGANDANTRMSKHWLQRGTKAALDAATDLQILQIGANIIDQADTDSYPTTIRFNRPTAPAAPYYLFGKEDVPYAVMTRITANRGRSRSDIRVYNHDWATGNFQPVAASSVFEVNFGLQVRLWRPHQAVEDYDGPAKFRIRPRHAVVSGSGSKIWTTNGWWMPGSMPRYNFVCSANANHFNTFTYTSPPPITRACSVCGTSNTLAGRVSIVPPDREANYMPQNSTAYQSPTANGDYSYWGGPSDNYGAAGQPFSYPRIFDGSESIVLNLDHGSNAFRDSQLVYSAEHGASAGYSVSGSNYEVRANDFPRAGLPSSSTQVAGFVLGKALTAKPESTGDNASRLRFRFFHFRSSPLDVIMEYQVPGTSQWRMYQQAEFIYATTNGGGYNGNAARGGGDACFGLTDWETNAVVHSSYLVDPRTWMWGGIGNVEELSGNISWNRSNEGQAGRYAKGRWNTSTDISTGANTNYGRPLYLPNPNYFDLGWNLNGWQGSAAYQSNDYDRRQFHAVVENDFDLWQRGASGSRRRKNFAYKDPDGVTRYGVAALNEYDQNQFLGNPMVSRFSVGASGAISTAESLAGRPRVLNRPFRSVGELGYVFRGTPWRDIDLLYSNSPDAALLDVFCVNEHLDADGNEVISTSSSSSSSAAAAEVVAGRVNLNHAGVDVVTALLRGAGRDKSGTFLTAEEARQIATVFVSAVNGQQSQLEFKPMVSLADLVYHPKPLTGTSLQDERKTGLMLLLSDQFSGAEDRSIKDRRQVVTRALTSGTTVRTWDFMMDLVVQSGRLSPKAASLTDFNAAAERRYWVHFALDRITGRLLDVQWERVTK